MVSNDYRANISPSTTGKTIVANISIGQPPIPQLLIADTASNKVIFSILKSRQPIHHHASNPVSSTTV